MIFADIVTSDNLNIGAIVMGLAGGLALFLFGLDQMSEALKLIAGNGIKAVLSKLTTNRFTGAMAGAFVTALIQSSSVTTVLVVGFISAGLLNLSQSIGIIMGANIGTTVTAQLVAFKITQYALLLIAIGFFLLFCWKNDKVRYYGRVIMGLGLIFFGMHLMSDATSPLRTYQPFMDMMQRMDNPLMAIVLAAAFTALVQSSSATTGIVITLASQGFISLEAGIALIYGANVGTCITAGLASLGKPRAAVQAAMVHVLFNAAGVAIGYYFIPELASFVTQFSPESAHLTGPAKLAAETPRQIANAHTVFNVANTLIFIWFTTPLAWLVQRILPPTETTKSKPTKAKYLDPILLETPALALDVVRLEMGRLGAAALHMMHGVFPPVIRGSHADLSALEDLDDNVDSLHAAVVSYLGKLSKQNLSDPQSEQLREYVLAANYIENIGDMIETNLVAAGRNRLKANLNISDATEEVLVNLNRKVYWAAERAIRAIVSDDTEAADEVAQAKQEINRLASEAESHLSRRLSADEPHRLAMFRLESEILEYLKRMYYFSKRIAKLVNNDQTGSADAEQAGNQPPEASVNDTP